MSSTISPVPNNTQIIQNYQGNGSPKECSLNYIPNREVLIKENFSEMGYFRKAGPIKQSLIYLKCLKLNHLEIIKTLGACTFVGGLVGGVVGAAGQAPGVVGGIAIGAGIGGAAGVFLCYHQGLYNEQEHIVSVVKNSTEYSAFRLQRTQEQYELFVAFFKNYASKIDDKYEARIADFVCSIIYDIPEYPVFSPFDEGRKNPYEKEAIEKYLDKMKSIVEPQVQKYNSECALLGIPPDDNNINEIRRAYCPLRTGYYTKEELIYDPEYVKGVIKTLKEIQKDLKGSLPAKEDPMILKGVDDLIIHYSKNNDAVIKSLVKALANDIFAIDGDFELANGASKKIKKFLIKA